MGTYAYGAIADGSDNHLEDPLSLQKPLTSDAHEEIEIEVGDGKEHEPTMAPIGTRLKRNAHIEYNPYDWRRTLFVVHGRTYVSRAFYVVSAIGTGLVLMSGIAGIGLETDRECRAWCSRFALGTQPHQYMGFILFLIMAFRNNEAYRMYQAGLMAHFKVKAALRKFVHAILNMVPRDKISEQKRGRMVAFAVAFPYALTADLRHERTYDHGTVDDVLDEKDLNDLVEATSMPLFVIDSLTSMVQEYCDDVCTRQALKSMCNSLEALYEPYGECERIRNNPCAFAYVAHLRLLLVSYLVTLPLAMVEQMGYSTIPVFWVICYSLMSLEMLAVEVEMPFGHGGSDLRLNEYNLGIKESLLETWDRWKTDIVEKQRDEQRQAPYWDLTSDSLRKQMSWAQYW